jgi:hypothetical protein
LATTYRIEAGALTPAEPKQANGCRPQENETMALLRPIPQWIEIFKEQTNGSAEQIAKRIMDDLSGYPMRSSRRWRDEDVDQLARALQAYARFNFQQTDNPSLNDLDRLLEGFP